jgi:hypothetical protein
MTMLGQRPETPSSSETKLIGTDFPGSDLSPGLDVYQPGSDVGLSELDILAGIPELTRPFLPDRLSSPINSLEPRDPTHIFKGWISVLIERAKGGDEAVMEVVGKPGTPDFEWNVGAFAREKSANGVQAPRPGEPLI